MFESGQPDFDDSGKGERPSRDGSEDGRAAHEGRLFAFSEGPEITSDENFDNMLGRTMSQLAQAVAGSGMGVEDEDPRVPEDNMQVDDDEADDANPEEGDKDGDGAGAGAGGGEAKTKGTKRPSSSSHRSPGTSRFTSTLLFSILTVCVCPLQDRAPRRRRWPRW
jgi:hypothetical protein